ncbi:glycosyltransferase [Glycomyces sp. NPDC046736]|uniref:glycosyltransferase n=1 Tax=Glycomyces sp. NPDC046736 TaxID=3155615 RepID=UPI003408F418
MRVTFLMTELNGLGGTARATLALVEGLLRRGDDVEIISVFSSPTQSDLHFPKSVRLRTLVDAAMTGAKAGSAERFGPDWDRAAQVYPRNEELYKRFNLYVEGEIAKALRDIETDVIVSTRTGLASCLAAFAPERVATVVQIHEDPASHNPKLRDQMRGAYRAVDAVQVLTDHARSGLIEAEPSLADKIHVLPNAIENTLAEPSPDGGRLVVAVGRLAPIKQFDLLIEAFAMLAGDFPEWRLRIFGRGPEGNRLRELVDRHGLGERIAVPGRTVPSFAEWAKADVGVSSSRVESFGISIVEAMRMGVPMVVTDVPSGPGEIITSGVDGLLVRPDAGSIADGMRTLMSDGALRASIGTQAAVTAERYRCDEVARRLAELLDSLVAERGGPRFSAPGRHAGDELMITVERTDTESAAITVHGADRPPLVLRSKSTGEEFEPEPESGGGGFDRYLVDRTMLAREARMEDWEVLSPSEYAIDHISGAGLLGAAPVSASDLLPQKVDGRLELRSRRRRRYAEVTSLTRIGREALQLEVVVIGESMGRARLCFIEQGGRHVYARFRGKRLGEGRFRFTLKAKRLLRISATPLVTSVRLVGDEPAVTVGSLADDMYGRRVLGRTTLEAGGAKVLCEWSYERSGSMAFAVE